MIKIGILGAETPSAGELIRILINHPDVVLLTAASSQLTPGTPVADIHPGLIGDTSLTLTPTLSPQGHDAIFLCGEPWEARQWMETNNPSADPDLRIIDLTGAFRDGSFSMVYGIPEHNRKPLVRGARRASLPSPVAMAVTLALFPLAKNMLLPTTLPITATITLPDPFASTRPTTPPSITLDQSTRLDPIAPIENRPDHETYSREIQDELRAIQPTTNPTANIRLTRTPSSTRALTATINLPVTQPLAELTARYDEAYQDHNFTYLIPRTPTPADVANTNKCLVHLTYPPTDPTTLRITAILDPYLKGSAGNAVHCLNLLFGLSERTGLALKASAI